MMASARAGGIARLGGEARAEFRRGIFAGHHEQVVEGGDGAAQRDARQALVQPVEEARRRGPSGSASSRRLDIRRQCVAARAQIAVRPVAEIEARFRVRARPGPSGSRASTARRRRARRRCCRWRPARCLQIRQTVYSIPYCFIFR